MKKALLPILTLLLAACGSPQQAEESTESANEMVEYVKDAHSHAVPSEAATTHLNLDIAVYFDRKLIRGVATYDIKTAESAQEIIFDTDDLTIEIVKDQNAGDLEYELKEADELGSALVVKLKPNTEKVAIAYTTGSSPEALQWLDPSQTSGGKEPFLFTQGQAILTRTWIPLQDITVACGANPPSKISSQPINLLFFD